MDQLAERLRPFSLIGLDALVFIYHFEQNPGFFPISQHILASIESGDRAGITSIITLLEISVRPLTLGQAGIARK